MRIESVEISNFRKLRSVRVDLSGPQTLLVGANNSGKTSAMVALDRFLRARGGFSVNDFPACHWRAINELGANWIASPGSPPAADAWADMLPALDLWLHVDQGEFHRVSALIPTLQWSGGLLGVRLRYEPEDLEALHRDFLTRTEAADAIRTDADERGKKSPSRVWPESMLAFLSRRLGPHFCVRTYLLDPAKYTTPKAGVARPQVLSADAIPVDGNPLKGLIKVDLIQAQRGLGAHEGAHDGDEGEPTGAPRRLSAQLRSYYRRHLDPERGLEPKDLDALRAIEEAETAFDKRLDEAFQAALEQVHDLGYPGVADPKVKVSTRIRPLDALAHDAAVLYSLEDGGAAGEHPLVLPEGYNGLGYQNLISMVFRLMAFRDGWMRVGKAGLAVHAAEDQAMEPIHLVLVEEPEAHLHAQVQQVFINKAFEVLRNHPFLGEEPRLTTQLVVSTHSSHVAHAVEYAQLRYFRRTPRSTTQPLPGSTVVNLSTVFGPESETARFATRYLKTSHSDLFFADAAIFIEGAAERILVPHFLRFADDGFLTTCYLSVLEIGGSHAFRLKPLVDALGLTTLVITDLDAQDPANNNRRASPRRSAGLKTANATLKRWAPCLSSVDELVDAGQARRSTEPVHEGLGPSLVVYPSEGTYVGSDDSAHTLIPTTFEDALILDNLALFGSLRQDGGAFLRKTVAAVKAEPNDLCALLPIVRATVQAESKAEFALDMLEVAEDAQLEQLSPPRYVAEGLQWLSAELRELRGRTLDGPLAEEAGA